MGKFRTVLGSRRFQDRSKYKPHQGDQECFRRIQQGCTSYRPMKRG